MPLSKKSIQIMMYNYFSKNTYVVCTVRIRSASAETCCGYSLEASHRGDSNEYPHVSSIK